MSRLTESEFGRHSGGCAAMAKLCCSDDMLKASDDTEIFYIGSCLVSLEGREQCCWSFGGDPLLMSQVLRRTRVEVLCCWWEHFVFLFRGN